MNKEELKNYLKDNLKLVCPDKMFIELQLEDEIISKLPFMENKYFYAAVIDDYQYSEVSTIRYKNFVDFAIHCMKDCIDDELKRYFKDKDTYFTDYQSFFDDYYDCTSYYFALDINGIELDDEEDNDLTFQNYCKKLNLI